MTKKVFISLILLLCFVRYFLAQQDTLNKNRLKLVVGTEVVGYAGVMTGLYSLWFADYPSSGFHSLNDNSSWQQMDKVGHCMTSYYVGMASYEALRWSGVKKNKAIGFGGTLGLFFLTSVEILDGYSAEWGASWGDVGANATGTFFFIGQEMLWDEQRILLKFSFHTTKYDELSPNFLGENLSQNIIKDYNGQTYWASVNIASFLSEQTKFPKWMNVAFGYGADGMTGTIENLSHPEIIRYRQYYVSLDIDLTRIKTKSKLANTLLGAFGFVKFPLPTVEFNSLGKTKFYGVYF